MIWRPDHSEPHNTYYSLVPPTPTAEVPRAEPHLAFSVPSCAELVARTWNLGAPQRAFAAS